MQWAKVIAVLSGVMLLLYVGTATNILGARQQPALLSIDAEGCTNTVQCAAEWTIGHDVVFSGELTTENGMPLPNANIEIVKLLPTPELVVVAEGVTGIDGTYSITWTASFSEKVKVLDDVTEKMLSESMEFFAQFNGDEKYAPARTGKLIATVEANDLFVTVNAEKRVYLPGQSALVFIAFVDKEDEFTDPDSMRVLFDDEELEVEKKKTGSYTIMTPPLTVDHHQVIVIPKKDGYNLENGFLTVQVSGFFGKV